MKPFSAVASARAPTSAFRKAADHARSRKLCAIQEDIIADTNILASDLLLVEVSNALWRKTSAKEISPSEADRAFDHAS